MLQGVSTYSSGGDGWAELDRAAQAMLEVGDPVRIAWAYTNLMEYGTAGLQLDAVDLVYDEALPFVVDHDIATYTFCIRATHAQVLVRRARHDEAIALVAPMLDESMSLINRCHALLPLGISRVRQGNRSGVDDLTRAWELARSSDDPEWMVNAAAAVAQVAWILDEPQLVDTEW